MEDDINLDEEFNEAPDVPEEDEEELDEEELEEEE